METTLKRSRGQFTALAILSLIVGLLLTLDNLGILTGTWKLWPVFPFFLGLGGVWFFNLGKEKDLITLGIGSYLVLISIFFFFLNFTSWGLMTTLWPTFIGVFGVSVLAVSYYAERKKWLIVSGLFFIFLAFVFFMVFTIEAKLWPVSLILFGIWLLIIPERRASEKKCSNS